MILLYTGNDIRVRYMIYTVILLRRKWEMELLKFLISDSDYESASKIKIALDGYGSCDIIQDGQRLLDVIERSEKEEKLYDAVFIALDSATRGGISSIKEIKNKNNSVFEKIKFVLMVNGDNLLSVLKLYSNSKFRFVRKKASKTEIFNVLKEWD